MEETNEIEDTVYIIPETIIAIAVLIIAFLENIKSHLQEIPKIGRKAAQAVSQSTRTTGCNRRIQGITEIYGKTMQVITHATRTAQAFNG